MSVKRYDLDKKAQDENAKNKAADNAAKESINQINETDAIPLCEFVVSEKEDVKSFEPIIKVEKRKKKRGLLRRLLSVHLVIAILFCAFTAGLFTYLAKCDEKGPIDTYYVSLKETEDEAAPDVTPTEYEPDASESAEDTDNTAQVFAASEQTSDYVLVAEDLSRKPDKIYVNNETSYTVDTESLLENKADIPKVQSSGPTVLIIHTHGSECYRDGESISQDETRSTDKEKNVISVGNELARVLESFGIGCVHCEELHDDVSFVKAYSNSMASMKEYLKEYPTVKYVIDLHRDSIVRDQNEIVKTSAEISGDTTAQLMLVIGTDENGAEHPSWLNNMTLACRIQSAANSAYPGLMRPINLRKSSFNQQICDGAFILEVGSYGNSLSEAKAAVKLFGQCFARMLLE